LTIPNGVYGIGSDAFRSCNKLSEVTFPDSLLTVAVNAFSGCYNIQTINASEQWKGKNSSLLSQLIKKQKT
jgi:hypothetical protein